MLYHRQETPNQQDIIQHQNSLLSISGKFKSGLLSSGIKPTVSGPRKPALTRPWSLLPPEGAAGYHSYKDKQKVSQQKYHPGTLSHSPISRCYFKKKGHRRHFGNHIFCTYFIVAMLKNINTKVMIFEIISSTYIAYNFQQINYHEF